MTFSRLVYTLVMLALLPLALLRLVWRSKRQPDYVRHIGERLGRYRAPPPEHPLIWIHAVSVGETRAAQPLIEALLQRYPDHHVLLTHMTPTGREAGESLFSERVSRCYLPYDYPDAVGRFLDHYRPRLGVLMETEIWCNLIHACREREIPLYLVNARLSEKSLRGYRRIAGLMRETLGAFSGIGAQSADDAKRLQSLGATRITVTGNLKFDVKPADANIALGNTWRAVIGSRPVLLAASTREGEESLLLDALPMLVPPESLLILAPRHPQRFDEVAALIRQRGLPFQRRSLGLPGVQDRIFLADSMGELAACYTACDIAFIGGSLVPEGGQNLIEACALGKPVIIGPSNHNFAQAVEGAVAAGAAMRVNSAQEVMSEASRIIGDLAEATRMGEAGVAFTQTHRGATQRTLDMLVMRSEVRRVP